LLNALLQIANKLGLFNKTKKIPEELLGEYGSLYPKLLMQGVNKNNIS
jgi:hypothetical protein